MVAYQANTRWIPLFSLLLLDSNRNSLWSCLYKQNRRSFLGEVDCSVRWKGWCLYLHDWLYNWIDFLNATENMKAEYRYCYCSCLGAIGWLLIVFRSLEWFGKSYCFVVCLILLELVKGARACLRLREKIAGFELSGRNCRDMGFCRSLEKFLSWWNWNMIVLIILVKRCNLSKGEEKNASS